MLNARRLSDSLGALAFDSSSLTLLNLYFQAHMCMAKFALAKYTIAWSEMVDRATNKPDKVYGLKTSLKTCDFTS